ncbi:hypothetical protein [Paeniglutamicibacter gangotriensis]|uniref:Uncharacterized protein n=1 Tax=Paeniglutamicibacter gangotriensis Lz1y TaxID=1276920 RepID=M7MPU6_9MICC|nr:hypothetical protein [Paeniglutamicibacter gangotriensis]EMQ98382.1 hypothetical protein ADIAG_02401 [Paeniglutamicibacter gangotriensis Lz1y]
MKGLVLTPRGEDVLFVLQVLGGVAGFYISILAFTALCGAL